MMKKFFILIAAITLLTASACRSKTCPAYSQATAKKAINC